VQHEADKNPIGESQSRSHRRWIGTALAFALVSAALVSVQVAGGATARKAGPIKSALGSSTALTTPANQPALDAAAADANSIAGASYFAGVSVDDDANVVNVYLDSAPQSVIDQLQAQHPGVYVIHNDAPNTLHALLALESNFNTAALSSAGIKVVVDGPTVDGHFEVGVAGNVATAQAALDQTYGSGAVGVYQTEPITSDTYRYDDVSPWNGGDFNYHAGGTDPSCTNGIPVHDTSSGQTYILTAAHCWYQSGGQYTSVRNGYWENDYSTIYGSKALIGTVEYDQNIQAGSTTLDSGLIQTSSSVLNFDAAWNSQGTAVQIGAATNNVGDQVCTSGAYDGQICQIVITQKDQTIHPNDGWGTYNVKEVAIASNPNNASAVASGEGDSGGPVYSYSGSNTLARGMIDAHSDNKTCTSNPPGTISPPPARTCGHVVYFVQLGSIDNQWGVTPNS
jgi:hypothetical protein